MLQTSHFWAKTCFIQSRTIWEKPTEETTSIDAHCGFGSRGTGRACDLSAGPLRWAPDRSGSYTSPLQINSSSSPSSEPAMSDQWNYEKIYCCRTGFGSDDLITEKIATKIIFIIRPRHRDYTTYNLFRSRLLISEIAIVGSDHFDVVMSLMETLTSRLPNPVLQKRRRRAFSSR